MSLTSGPILKLVAGNIRLERIWLLAKLDFQKRYYESFLGMLWALLNPILMVGIYYLAFAFIRTSSTDNFALHLFSGIIIWQFVTEATNKSMNILKSNLYLINNIKFNWFDVYISMIISIMLGFLWKLAALFIFCFGAGLYPSSSVIYLPILVLILSVITLGISLILSIFKLYVKDLQHVWSMVIRLGFWTAPIIFTIEKIEALAPWLVWAHPATCVIINIRNAVIYGLPMDYAMLFWSIGYGTVVLLVGLLVFNMLARRAVSEINS